MSFFQWLACSGPLHSMTRRVHKAGAVCRQCTHMIVRVRTSLALMKGMSSTCWEMPEMAGSMVRACGPTGIQTTGVCYNKNENVVD